MLLRGGIENPEHGFDDVSGRDWLRPGRREECALPESGLGFVPCVDRLAVARIQLYETLVFL